jgi:MFS family permease
MRGSYYGWWMVAIALAACMLVVGSVYNSYGVFVLPVSAEFHLSRADINTGLILVNLGGASMAPFIGRLLDRTRVRVIMIAAAISMGASFAALGLSHSILLSAIVLALTLPAGALAAATITMPMLIARWFVAQRGRAMALAMTGMYLGSVVITPLVAWAVEAMGWRSALLVMAGAISVLLIGLALVVRAKPGPGDVEPAAKGASAALGAPSAAQAAAQPPSRLGVLLRNPQLWTITLSAGLTSATSQALMVSFVPLGREAGLSPMHAASLMSALGGGAVSGAVLLSVFADKLDRVLILVQVFILAAIVNAMLLLDHSYGLLLASAALMGAVNGATGPASFALYADRFGPQNFGVIRGISALMICGISIVTIRFAGEVFDRTGSYRYAFLAFSVVQIVAAALMLSAGLQRRAPAAARATAP